MKNKKLFFTVFVAIVSMSLIGQNTLNLTFTGDDNGQYVQLDSIQIINHTQGGSATVVYPDTVFDWDQATSIAMSHAPLLGFQIEQNQPNPFRDYTSFKIHLPEASKIKLAVLNLMGQKIISFENELPGGTHIFGLTPDKNQGYVLLAIYKGYSKSIKMINQSITEQECKIEYLGMENAEELLYESKFYKNWDNDDFVYDAGDELLIVGFTGTTQSGFIKVPGEVEEYTIQFAADIPCIGNPTVEYGGQTYNAVQIFNQCWLKENLNVGLKINSNQDQTDNDTIEKYCFFDNEYYCDLLGGLYFWDELMQYTDESGGQGICPVGWHIPTDMEWNILEGAADSQYSIGDPNWEQWNFRGFDAGGNLKQMGTTYWEYPNSGALDVFGFTALPGGYFVQDEYWGAGYKAVFYTSDIDDNSVRIFWYDDQKIERHQGGGGLAGSIRCIKN